MLVPATKLRRFLNQFYESEKVTNLHALRVAGAVFVVCLVFFTASCSTVNGRFSVSSPAWTSLVFASLAYIIAYVRSYIYHGFPITCPTCKGRFASNVPWVCGYCHKDNTPYSPWSTFLNKCTNEKCRSIPPAFRCPNGCGTVLVLTDAALSWPEDQVLSVCAHAVSEARQRTTPQPTVTFAERMKDA